MYKYLANSTNFSAQHHSPGLSLTCIRGTALDKPLPDYFHVFVPQTLLPQNNFVSLMPSKQHASCKSIVLCHLTPPFHDLRKNLAWQPQCDIREHDQQHNYHHFKYEVRHRPYEHIRKGHFRRRHCFYDEAVKTHRRCYQG